MVRPVSGDTEYSSPQNTTVTLLWITIRSPNPCRHALARVLAADDVRPRGVTDVCGGLVVSASRLPVRPFRVHPPAYSAAGAARPHCAVSHWTSAPGEAWPARATTTVAHTLVPFGALTVYVLAVTETSLARSGFPASDGVGL